MATRKYRHPPRQSLEPCTHRFRKWYSVMKQDHLVCFLGGSFLLGITEGGRRHVDWEHLDEKDHLDYMAGTGIIDSCMQTYQTAT